MSYDVQLAWPCPHLITEERVSLSPDRRTLALSMPVASTQTVEIRANDSTLVPPTGLLTTALLFSGKPGPYDLFPNYDTLTVTTSGGSWTLSLGLTRTARFTASALRDKFVRLLQMGDPLLVTVENEHLVFQDVNRAGTRSFVTVSGSGVEAFGFGSSWSAQGNKVYPAWSLELQSSFQGRAPVFQEWVRSNPTWMVSYATYPNRCRRCQGIEVENDCRFSVDGDVILVDGEDLLYQASLKILLTQLGSNPYHPEYGTSITSRIGTKATANVVGVLTEEVRSALSKLQILQRGQARYQTVTQEERLYALQGVNVRTDANDPTKVLIDVTIQNASNQPISLSIVYTAPGVTSRVSPTGLTLG